MDTKTLILTLVRFGSSPDALRILQPYVGYTDAEWDDAIATVMHEEEEIEKERLVWLATLPTQKERERGFEDDGSVSIDQRLAMKQRYLEAEYERLLRKDERSAEDERKIRKIRNEYSARFVSGGLAQDDIERAKNVPISRIVNVQRNFTNCPFHNEKTPSMCVYKNNTFYCFGCRASGDVIHLVRKIHGFGFVEAVRWLITI